MSSKFSDVLKKLDTAANDRDRRTALKAVKAEANALAKAMAIPRKKKDEAADKESVARIKQSRKKPEDQKAAEPIV